MYKNHFISILNELRCNCTPADGFVRRVEVSSGVCNLYFVLAL